VRGVRVCVVQMMPGGCVAHAHVSRLPLPVIGVGDAVAWQVPWVLGGPGDRGRFVRGGVSSGSTAGDDRERRGPAAAVHGLCDVNRPWPHALVSVVWCGVCDVQCIKSVVWTVHIMRRVPCCARSVSSSV
jgi:hypothetical protein